MTRAHTPLIAVDGGGTGCRVAVGTAADGVLGNAKGGPANVSTNFDHAISNIVTAVHAAASDAGWSCDVLAQAVAHLGLAGADLDDMQRKTSTSLPFGPTRVSGDRQTTVAGVLGDQDGFVVALGTGTIIARQQAGIIKTVSGWGFQLSDKASGAWLGRALLSRVLDADEALEPHSPLTRAICDRMGGVQGVFAFSTNAVPRDYAEFAPELFAAGAQGDVTALDILQAGSRYMERGLTALGFVPGDVLSLSGGVGPHFAPYLQESFKTNMHDPRGNALAGAFMLARQLAEASAAG